MIPQFPKFKKLEITDKKQIESYSKTHPPYSDYNFFSLYSYNTKDSAEVSFLNDNLVICFQDYVSGETFYSFLGTNKIKETIDTLLAFAKKHSSSSLKMIPEVVIQQDKDLKRDYQIEEDRDNFDYILSIDDLVNLNGNRVRGKRNFVNRFKKHYPQAQTVLIDIIDSKIQKKIKKLFIVWEERQEKTKSETEIEFIAIQRIMNLAVKTSHMLISIGIYIENELIAFSINEIVHDEHGVIHFEKADTNYIGAFSYLKHMTARMLQERGCKHINYEQDLGIPGLRKAKEAWQPVHYLKKYIISPKQNS